MSPNFVLLKMLYLTVNLFFSLETLDTDTCLVDAGLKFQGQRSAFQMLAPMVSSMGVDSKLWTLLTLVNNVHLSFGLDQLNNFMDGKLKQQFNPQKSAQGKAGLARVLGGMLTNMGLQEMLPLPVKNLHKVSPLHPYEKNLISRTRQNSPLLALKNPIYAHTCHSLAYFFNSSDC